MKQTCTCIRRMWTVLSRIHLVDKCLILFMLVLLTQSSYSMFFSGGAGTETDSIDIIIRTSSAAIFGYFLSANFIRHASLSEDTSQIPPGEPKKEIELFSSSTQDLSPKNQMGFSVPGTVNSMVSGSADDNMTPQKNPQLDTASRLQIIVAATIGLFCLISLLILRNMAQWNISMTSSSSLAATVAQFRDFVSSCVGFLIGCPTNNTGK